HSYLADIGRVSYEPITDSEAMDAFRLLCRTEGIIPAIESAHALAGAIKVGQRLAAEGGGASDVADKIVIVNLSGRGDKDVATAAEWFDLLDKDSPEHEIAKEGEQL
ncbi:MAG: tryptophan synthase subunit beta, partial [Arthrobacter sp.]